MLPAIRYTKSQRPPVRNESELRLPAHLVKCLLVLETDVTNCARWMFGRNSVMLSHILLIHLQAVTGVTNNWTMDGDHVLWPM